MPLGTFVLVIGGEQQDGTAETKARLHLLPQGVDTLIDADADEFKFPSKFAKATGEGISLSPTYELTLFTDSDSGPSTTIGYEGYVATGNGGRVDFQIAAQEAGTTKALTDLTDEPIVSISSTQQYRDEAEAAATAAAASAASVNREQASGVAGLTAAGKLYEARIPDRLSEVALGATYAPAALPEAGPLIEKLQRGVSDAVVTVLGDSTGQGNTTTDTRWVYRLAVALAAKYPAYTVTFHLWNSGTVDYDAPVTIATGTGPRTLAIRSGSASGQTTTYSLTNLATLSPATPDLLFISHGHNHDLANYKTGILALVNAVKLRHKSAPVVIVGQNPRAPADTDYTVQQQIREYAALFAARHGLGFIDATTPFQQTASYATALMVDGTHPNAAGHQLWADGVAARLRPTSYAPARIAPTQQNVITIPAGMFSASSGTPAMVGGAVDRPYGGWALDSAAAESISTIAYVPPDWQKVQLRVLWSVIAEPGGNAGAVVLDIYAYPMPAAYPGAMGTRHTLGGITSAALTGSGEINKLRTLNWSPDTSFELTERGQIGLTVFRFANTGADTLGIDAVIVALEINRVE